MPLSCDQNTYESFMTAPVGKVSLRDRPTFAWTKLSEADGYVVEVYDEQFNLVTKSEELKASQWLMPRPLARGRLYAWQVRALKEGREFVAPTPPAPQAKFKVLGQAQADEIARARRAYGQSHLTLGLLYAQAGLLDEAAQELRALQKANPDSTLVRRLRASLQTLRR